MSDAEQRQPKDACPHCGKRVSLPWWSLLPSRDRSRLLTCRACGGRFDLTNRCKMTSVMAGMAGMAIATAFPFQWIVNAGHASKASVVFAIAVAVFVVIGAAAAGARLALGFESKP